MIKLSKDGWDVDIVPEYGASILKCTHGGQDILHPAAKDWLDKAEPFASSCFPLVPFSNRIKNGQFTFEDFSVNLPKNHPEQDHVIHGNGWTSSWEVNLQDEGSCELSFQHEGGDWPWPFATTYRIEVSGASMTQTLSITNTGHIPMPAGVGFHPYFPHREKARLTFNASGIWEVDAEMLPRNWQAQEGAFDFSKPQHLRDRHYDNCLTGWDGKAQIEWRDVSKKVQITGNAVLDHAVFYTPLDQPFFCFEPVSHGNNALADACVMDEGQTMKLEAGDTLQGEMVISVLSP